MVVYYTKYIVYQIYSNNFTYLPLITSPLSNSKSNITKRTGAEPGIDHGRGKIVTHLMAGRTSNFLLDYINLSFLVFHYFKTQKRKKKQMMV
jgi:hypothetical protein